MKNAGNISDLSDEELVNLYKQESDNQYLGILFKRYSHLVFGVCLKYLKDEDDSKDAAMQVFEKLFIELKKHQIQHFKAWLHTVTKYHCLMILRSSNKESSGHEAHIMEIEAFKHQVQGNDEESLENEMKLQHMESSISELEPSQQTCIRLFYLEGKSYQQVAHITGYSLKQVKSYLQNGKRNLKLKLSKNE